MTSDSQNTVEKVQKLYTNENDHGTQKAYDALRKDYEDYAKSHGGYGSEATKAYWDDVTKKLGDNVLPNLAVVWGQQNREKLARGGEFEKYDLGMVADRRSSSDLDTTMANSLVKNYETIRKANYDSEGGFLGMGTHDKDKITKGDLDSRIAQIDTARSERLKGEREAGENKANVAKLTSTVDGSPDKTLFNKLDAMPGGKKDGEINTKDFDRYLQDYDYRKSTGQLDSLTPDQRKAADSEAATVKYLKDNWDKPEVQRLRKASEQYYGDEGGGGSYTTYGNMTKESLAAAGGFKDIGEAAAKNKLVAPTPEVEKQKEVTETKVTPPEKGKPDQAHATQIFDGMVFDKGLGEKLVTKEGQVSYIKEEQLTKVLDGDKANGGKDLTQAQREGLTYLKDNFKTLAPDGKFDLADIPRSAFNKGDDKANFEAMKAHTSEVASSSKAVAEGVAKLGGVEKLGKDGTINKADLDDRLAKATDKTTEEYKTLDGLRKNFDNISHNGKTINAEEMKAFGDKFKAGGGGGGETGKPETAVEDKTVKEFKAKIATDATQVGGEGPYQAAARLLPGASHAEIAQLTKLLKKSYQDMNNDHTDGLAKLPVGYSWLNEKNMSQILAGSPALAKRFEEGGKAKAAEPEPEAEPKPKKVVPNKTRVNQQQPRVILVNNEMEDEDTRGVVTV